MKPKTISVGEACIVVMGQSPPGESYNVSGDGLPFFQGKADFGEVYPTVRVFCKEPSRIAERGDILMSVRAPVGPTNLAKEKCCIGRGLAALRTGPRLDVSFLLYFLRHHEPRLASQGQGSTFEAINREDLEQIEIPLRGLPEQRHIAGRLEQADRLRRTRRYALELSDEFFADAFIDLFYQANFRRLTVEEVAVEKPNAIRTGPFGSQLLHSEFTDSGIAVLGIDNAVNNRFVWDQRRFISPMKYDELKRYTVSPGDVLITIMGTCGRCAIVPDNIPPAINTKHLCCITLNPKLCLPNYLHGAFLYHPFVRQQLRRATKGAIMEGLNMEIIKGLQIPLPPLPMQQRWSAFVQRVEKLGSVQREAMRQAEHLFQSLLRDAFGTEITHTQSKAHHV